MRRREGSNVAPFLQAAFCSIVESSPIATWGHTDRGQRELRGRANPFLSTTIWIWPCARAPPHTPPPAATRPPAVSRGVVSAHSTRRAPDARRVFSRDAPGVTQTRSRRDAHRRGRFRTLHAQLGRRCYVLILRHVLRTIGAAAFFRENRRTFTRPTSIRAISVNFGDIHRPDARVAHLPPL